MAVSSTVSARRPQCLSQVNQGRWCQESYETATKDAGRRAKELRALGYTVVVEGLGSQVTRWGLLKVTLVDIRPGTHEFTDRLPKVDLV